MFSLIERLINSFETCCILKMMMYKILWNYYILHRKRTKINKKRMFKLIYVVSVNVINTQLYWYLLNYYLKIHWQQHIENWKKCITHITITLKWPSTWTTHTRVHIIKLYKNAYVWFKSFLSFFLNTHHTIIIILT